MKWYVLILPDKVDNKAHNIGDRLYVRFIWLFFDTNSYDASKIEVLEGLEPVRHNRVCI